MKSKLTPVLENPTDYRSRRLLEAEKEAEWGRHVRRGRGHADMEAEAAVSPKVCGSHQVPDDCRFDFCRFWVLVFRRFA